MKRPLRYTLLILWMLVIFYLSSEGSDTSSERSGAIVDTIRVVAGGLPTDFLTFLTRKAAHMVAYFILGVLMYSVVRTYNLRPRMAVLLSIGLVCAYAISDEVHQLFVPGRSGEVRDVLIDTTAGAAGVGIYYYVKKWYKTSKSKQNGV